MKRTLLTGLFLIIGAAIVAKSLHVDFETIAAAEQASSLADAAPVSVPATSPFATLTDGPQKATRTIKKTVYIPEVREIKVEESDYIEWQCQEYTRLMLQKARLMSEEERETAIAELKAELHAQHQEAEAELQQAVDILDQLIEQSAGTSAADRARLAIGLLKNQGPTSIRHDQQDDPFADAVIEQ